MWRDRRPISGGGDYILGMHQRDFYNVSIRGPILLIDHRMILENIKGEGSRRSLRYCKVRSTCPIVTPKWGPMKEGYSYFSDLKKTVSKHTWKARVAASWIS